MAFDYSKLRGKIREVFKTQENFAKSVGISSASLSAKLTGKVQFTQNEINTICALLEIDSAEIAVYFFNRKS